MTETAFLRRHESEWSRLEKQLADLPRAAAAADREEIVAGYRRVCQHLSFARQRVYGHAVVDRLNALALAGHHAIYGTRRGFGQDVLAFVTGGFARLVRERWPVVAGAAASFLLPAMVAFVLNGRYPDLAPALLGHDVARSLEQMYDPSSAHFLRARAAESDILMWAFYLWNNVGIGLRTFAGGVLFGVGALLVLVYNGLVLGAAAAHMHQVGFDDTFIPFVLGHSSLELTGLVLTGAAGAELGIALIAPGRRTRGEALRAARGRSVGMICGASGMIILAAFVEAFWSSQVGVPAEVKVGVAAVLWSAVLLYFALAGRR